MLEQAYPGPGPRPLAAWMTLLGALQYADKVVRKTGAHLEFESTAWTAAFTLSLPIYSTCSTLLENGLKAPPVGGDNNIARDEADLDISKSLHSARLGAYVSVSKAAANGILAWSTRGQANGLFHMSPQRYEEAGTGLVMIRPSVHFKIHTDPVSFHLPLHRFFAAGVLEGAQQVRLSQSLIVIILLPFLTARTLAHTHTAAQGLGLPPLDLPDPSHFATLLAEFPLRCMSLNAQVTAGLWRRNGISIQGQAMHYSTAPFCKVFRDLDLAAVQYATILGGNELVLGLLLDRLLLSRWAVEPHLVPSGPFEPKDFVVLAEEALYILILLVTELPGPPSK